MHREFRKNRSAGRRIDFPAFGPEVADFLSLDLGAACLAEGFFALFRNGGCCMARD